MGVCSFKNVRITGIKGVVPQKVINIDDEIQYYNNDLKKLERNKKILGLGTRHVVEEDITTADLCLEAAKQLLNDKKINKSEIDALLFVSTTPDYIAPSTSHILQGLLDLDSHCSCLDINGGCTSFVHALWTAHALISSGAAKKILILGGEIPSQRNDVRNRITSMLLADAGAAVLVEYTENDNDAFFLTGSYGKAWDKLVVPAGGARFPIRADIANIEVTDKAGNVWHLWDDIMKGMDVFNFTMEIGPKSITDILEYAKLSIDDIDLFAIHQANKQIVDTIRKHAGLPSEKTPTIAFEKYSNCSTISFLTVLMESLTTKMQRVLVCTFGVGLSWGTCIINTKNLYNGGMSVLNKTETKTRKEKADYWIKYFKDEL